MNHIKIGVIGAGRMGQHHCRVYSSLRHVNFVGIYDKNLKTSKEVANRYNVQAFNQIEELIERVDAVSIATPTPTHFDIAMQCLERGLHVLLEKPITETEEQAERLIKNVQASCKVFQVGHIERFNPTYTELITVLEDFQVQAINFRRLSPYQGSNIDVDVVMDLMVHDIDLALNLIKREPASISAYGLAPVSGSLDYVVADLWYPESPLVTLTASRITEQKIRSIDVTAREAYLDVDLLNKGIFIHRRSLGEYTGLSHGAVKYRQESVIERILVPNIEPLLLEIQHFLDCIRQDCTPCVSAVDGYKALHFVNSIRCLANQHLKQSIEEFN